MSIKEKLAQYIKYKGISVNSFENSAGWSRGYLRKLEHYRLVRTFADLTPATVKKFDDLLRREGGPTSPSATAGTSPCNGSAAAPSPPSSSIRTRIPSFARRSATANRATRSPPTNSCCCGTLPSRPPSRAYAIYLYSPRIPAALARVRDLFIFSAYTGLAQTVVDDGAKLAGKIR